MKLTDRTEKTSGLTNNDLIHVVNGGSSWKVKLSTWAAQCWTYIKTIMVAGDFPILNQNTTGTAANANTLTTSRNFAISGDVATTSPQAFNGSANVTLPVVLQNINKLTKVVYIDGDLGNDSTGAYNTALKPYKTIGAAYSAYVSDIATPNATDRVLFIVSKISIGNNYTGVDFLSLTDSVELKGTFTGLDTIFYGKYNLNSIVLGDGNAKLKFIDCEILDNTTSAYNFYKSTTGTAKISFQNCKIKLVAENVKHFVENGASAEAYFYNCTIQSLSKSLIKDTTKLIMQNCVCESLTNSFIQLNDEAEAYIRETYINADVNEITITASTNLNLYGNVFLKTGITGGTPAYGSETTGAPQIPILV